MKLPNGIEEVGRSIEDGRAIIDLRVNAEAFDELFADLDEPEWLPSGEDANPNELRTAPARRVK